MLDVIFPAQKEDQQFKEDFFAVCKEFHKLNIFEDNFNNIIHHRNVPQIIRALAFLSKITNRGPGFPTVYPLFIASENEHIDVAAHLLSEEGAYPWSGISDVLITQQMLDETFTLVRQGKSRQEIVASLAQLRE